MRAIVRQVCGVCGWTVPSKAEMDSHIAEHHGIQEGPVWLTRSKDQREFKPCLSQTPWGEELKRR